MSNYEKLSKFLSVAQLHAIACGMRGEEKEFFKSKVAEILATVEAMPKTYDTERAEDPVVWMHYFAGGQANWYITEKDAGEEYDDPAENGRQHQAFGLADLFGDGGEIGYISIQEIIENRGEMDFYWKPKPLSQVRNKHAA